MAAVDEPQLSLFQLIRRRIERPEQWVQEWFAVEDVEEYEGLDCKSVPEDPSCPCHVCVAGAVSVGLRDRYPKKRIRLFEFGEGWASILSYLVGKYMTTEAKAMISQKSPPPTADRLDLEAIERVKTYEVISVESFNDLALVTHEDVLWYLDRAKPIIDWFEQQRYVELHKTRKTPAALQGAELFAAWQRRAAG